MNNYLTVLKGMAAGVLLLLMVVYFTGCSSREEAPRPCNIAFVVGIADDESVFDAAIDEFAALPGLAGSTYTFVSPAGQGAVIDRGTIPDLTHRGYTDTMLERIAQSVSAELAGTLSAYAPAQPGLDMAGATGLAVRSLSANAREGVENVLVYYCSGRSTAGVIDFTSVPVYAMDAAASAAAVARDMDVDMSGVDRVIWYGCGDFAGDQPRLSGGEQAALRDFYGRLFSHLGAKVVTFSDDLPLPESYDFPVEVPLLAVSGPVSGLARELLEGGNSHA